MRIPAWLFVIGILLVFVVTGLLSVAAFAIAQQFAIASGQVFGEPLSFSIGSVPTSTPQPTVSLPTPTPAPTIPGATVVPALPTATLDPAEQFRYTDPFRVNILLLGIDQRSALNEPGPFRTDTMMVVSLDPVRKTAGILSIPRDLWVSIPGSPRPDRINNANVIGDVNGYPGGGPALAAETVRQVLGIPIDKYVLINFEVFTTVVAAIAPDGVEVCLNEAIDDEYYPDASYGFIRVQFPAGCQILDAERLLQYARTRHGNTDFDRAARQQQVMQSLRDKVLNVGGLTQFIGQAPALYSQLSTSVKTNMSLDEMLRLASLVLEIPRENIRTGVIDYLYAEQATTNSGDQVLVLRSNAVGLLLNQVLYPDTTTTGIADLRARAETENASIIVLNNTTTSGLASQTRDWLRGKGLNNLDVGDTQDKTGGNTVIRVYGNAVSTAKYLAELMGLPADRIESTPDPAGNPTGADIAIVIGPDVQGIIAGQ